MNCKKYRLMASDYMDRQLAGEAATDYVSHLEGCADCRAYLEDLRDTSLVLRSVEEPRVPEELKSYIMTAVSRHASKELSLGQRGFEWLLRLNPLPISYLAGAMASVVLFTFVLSAFKPLPMIGDDGKHITAVPVITGPIVTGSEPEYNSYNNLPPSTASTGNEPYYELPRVIDNGSLVTFSHIAYDKVGTESMSALVEVSSDGHAELLEILDEPRDPELVEQLWWSLSKPTFQPARVKGRAVQTRIVLVVEKVDVSG
ncbi:MAG TPA: zf-HC2 domain-containing protein [Blastocatellia bacterium]|nr:zf-HC2 domain-containing protein [Blastocatellia bacterium]